MGVFICFQNIDAKNKLNLRIRGIHLLNPYKTVVSHLKMVVVLYELQIQTVEVPTDH